MTYDWEGARTNRCRQLKLFAACFLGPMIIILPLIAFGVLSGSPSPN